MNQHLYYIIVLQTRARLMHYEGTLIGLLAELERKAIDGYLVQAIGTKEQLSDMIKHNVTVLLSGYGEITLYQLEKDFRDLQSDLQRRIGRAEIIPDTIKSNYEARRELLQKLRLIA